MPPLRIQKKGWKELIDATVELTIAARKKRLDAQLAIPFDSAAHSTEIGVGTRVGYAHAWLKSIGAGPTSELWFYRGTVTEIVEHAPGFVLANVTWDVLPQLRFPEPPRGLSDEGDRPPPGRVNIVNLARVGPNLKFCGT